jgi:hypothetical protein
VKDRYFCDGAAGKTHVLGKGHDTAR